MGQGMDDSDETLGEAIESLRSATVRLGQLRDEIDLDDEAYGRLDGQLCILDSVLDELERLYDEAMNELL
jgi:hypothetical protein